MSHVELTTLEIQPTHYAQKAVEKIGDFVKERLMMLIKELDRNESKYTTEIHAKIDEQISRFHSLVEKVQNYSEKERNDPENTKRIEIVDGLQEIGKLLERESSINSKLATKERWLIIEAMQYILHKMGIKRIVVDQSGKRRIEA